MTDKLRKALSKNRKPQHKRTDARVSLGGRLNEALHDDDLKKQVSKALRSGKSSRFTTENGDKTVVIVR